MKRTLLVDSDIVAFKFASMAETATDWGDDQWTLHADEKEAKDRINDHVEALQEKLKADAVIMALSCRSRRYWRHDVDPTYKAGRSNVRKPLILMELKQYLADSYESFERPNLEADDVLGILATSSKIVKGERIVVSEDKDMKSFPCLLYNPRKHDVPVEVSEDEANWNFLYQTLIGDATDGYHGLPGIGPKKAEKILPDVGATLEELWEAVKEAFESAGLTEQEAIIQARLARILRVQDYNFKKKEVILWTPPE